MSAIGRVFIVLNLILAGAFVGFAGTYLQQATDWKAAHAKLDQEFTEFKGVAAKQAEAHSRELNKSNTELQHYRLQLETSNAEVAKLRQDNQRLEAQRADLDADIKKLQSSYTTVAQAIDQATKESKAAYQMALKASSDKNEAVAAQEKAEKALADATFSMKKLRDQIAQQNDEIAKLGAENNEKGVLLAIIKAKAPGLLAMAQPDLQGSVQVVGPAGKLVTIQVTANPGKAQIKPGYTFAIYNGNTYKGEAVVTRVEGKFVFANLTKKVGGMTIAAGDRAATNVGF